VHPSCQTLGVSNTPAMAEQTFFATEADHESLINLLISEYEAIFVLDGTDPQIEPMTTIEAVMDALRRTAHDPRFFVISPQWQVEPLQFGQTVTSGGVTRHHVQPGHGGPSFDYLANRVRVGEQGSQVVASWFSDFSHYHSLLNPRGAIARPTRMAAAYKAVRKTVARGGSRTDVQEIQKPGPMAMLGARQAFKAGTWLRVGEWHHVPRGDA
jgi:hypothetical protein